MPEWVLKLYEERIGGKTDLSNDNGGGGRSGGGGRDGRDGKRKRKREGGGKGGGATKDPEKGKAKINNKVDKQLAKKCKAKLKTITARLKSKMKELCNTDEVTQNCCLYFDVTGICTRNCKAQHTPTPETTLNMVQAISIECTSDSPAATSAAAEGKTP